MLYRMGKRSLDKIANLNKIPHPKGRKAAQIAKKTIQSARREKTKFNQQMKTNILGEKIMWFQKHLDPVDSYTPELAINLIERYLGRFDEELEQIKLKHTTGMRKGRQHANREDIIKMTIKNEKNEFSTCGIEMPDILNSKQLNLLKNWGGELKYLQHFKLVRYTRGKLEKMKCSVKKNNSSDAQAAEKIKENQKEKNTNEPMDIDIIVS